MHSEGQEGTKGRKEKRSLSRCGLLFDCLIRLDCMRRNLKKKSQNKRECKVSNCKSSLLQLQSNGAQDLLAIHQTSSVFLSCWDVSRNMYDFVIVGAGLVGSAAAKYICKLSPGSRVCLVGPNEPSKQERTLESGRRVFGAHDDEGRITRTLGTNSVWAKLANRSIKRYRAIERESGVSFFSEVCTMVYSSIIMVMVQVDLDLVPFVFKFVDQLCSAASPINVLPDDRVW